MGNNLGEEGAKQLAEVIAERILQLKELVSFKISHSTRVEYEWSTWNMAK